MTSNTLIKATVIAVVLTAVPLAWQQSRNTTLRHEIATLHAGLPSPVVLPAPATVSEKHPLQSARLLGAQNELATLKQERATEEIRLASLQKQARQLQDEVVISLGRVDDVARRVAEFSRLVMEMDAAGADEAKRAEFARKFMPKMTDMMPVFAEMNHISANPELHARLDATTTATLAGVDDQVRDEMQRLLLPHYQEMQRNGLTLDKRPATPSDDWDRRYGEASAAAMRSIEPLLPASILQSKMWQDTVSPVTNGHSAFLDMLTRQPATPKGKP